ncbi:TetR/AcrR family transcriptional regulator [Methylovirgula sp. 4M-Z18]|uniref:TetR/AcrR family transcriptional regulator n=1 Tax=Methylovirgula sp. 4M-Z18 TaxID=2293567 RepID=UPI000E2F0803|nr:TetR/AcrR family transcriptional regulator [Methylovirgula sp. 4M-Z18]RFB78387.1 TetR/AcrR family transcriptional regulator [Methylovirgula sp. 4M-Z18]
MAQKRTAPDDTSASKDARSRIIEALMNLAANQHWDHFTLSDVAHEAGVSLAEFRDLFPSKGAVLGAFSRKIDHQVLAGTTHDLDDEPKKERLFDVLMRRLDALAPYRGAIKEILAKSRRDPFFAAALNQVAVNSHRFMLEAAGIDVEGPAGAMKIQGLVFAWIRVLDVWVHDDTSGLDRTMAKLDKELTRGGHMAQRVDDLQRITAPLHAFASAVFDTSRRFRRRARYEREPKDDDKDKDAA